MHRCILSSENGSVSTPLTGIAAFQPVRWARKPGRFEGFHSVNRNCGISKALATPDEDKTLIRFHSVNRNCGISTSETKISISLWRQVSTPLTGIAAFQPRPPPVSAVKHHEVSTPLTAIAAFQPRPPPVSAVKHHEVSTPLTGIAAFQLSRT